MKYIKHGLIIFGIYGVLGSFTHSFAEAEEQSHGETFVTNIAVQDMAREWLNKLEQRFLDLKHIHYVVVRTSTKGRQTQGERWTFSYSYPDCLRIEILGSQGRLITINEATMWEFIPAGRKALKTDLSSLSIADRMERLLQVMGRVSIDGIHPGNVENLVRNISAMYIPKDVPQNIQFTGIKPQVKVTVDTKRNVLIDTEIYSPSNDLLLRTHAMNFVEVFPDYWFPQVINVVHQDKGEYIESKIELQNIKLNEPVDASNYEFVPMPGVTVVKAK